MLKRPSLRDPSNFSDIFTVLLAAVTFVVVLSVVIENDTFRDVIVILLVIVFGWISWAVHNILVNQTEEQDETFQ